MLDPLQLVALLKNSGNPMPILQQMAGDNPQVAQALKMIQTNDPREVALNLAKSSNISQMVLTVSIRL